MRGFIGLILSLFLVFFLMVGGGVLWVLNIQAEDFKAWVTDEFSERTGRELSINGEVALQFYPWLGLQVQEVQVANATGFGNLPIFSADKIALRLKTLPMLRGRYEIDTVIVDGLALNLKVAANGRDNWSSITQALGNNTLTSSTSNQSNPKSNSLSFSSSDLINDVVLGGVDIRDLSINYTDDFTNKSFNLSKLNLSIGQLIYGQPLDLSLSFYASASPSNLNVETTAGGTVLYDLDAGRYRLEPFTLQTILKGPTVPEGSTIVRLRTAIGIDINAGTFSLENMELRALDTEIDAQINASNFMGSRALIAANTSARGSDLATWFSIFNYPELAQRIAKLDSQFNIIANINGDLGAGNFTIPTLQAKLLNADINGDLSLQGYGTTDTAITTKLDAAGPDLPTLVEVIGIIHGGENSPINRVAAELARVPEKNFRIQWESSADMGTHRLSVPVINLDLLGSQIKGKLSAREFTDFQNVKLESELDGEGDDLPLLLQISGAFFGPDLPLYTIAEQLRLGVSDRTYSFNTAFDVDMARGNLNLSTLKGKMLGFTGSGQLQGRDLQNQQGIVSGELNIKGENLEELLRALGFNQISSVARTSTIDMLVGGTPSNLRLSPLRAELVVEDPQIPNSLERLTLVADSIVNLDENSVEMENFSLSGLNLQLGGTLRLRDLNSSPNFTGNITLPPFNARDFLNQLNLPLPAMADSTALTRLALSSRFGGTLNSINLNDMQLELDESKITGSWSMSDFASRATQFQLQIDEINADSYLTPHLNQIAPEDTPATTPIPAETLQKLLIDGQLKIHSLVLEGLKMNNVSLDVRAQDGLLFFSPFKAELYSGQTQASLQVDSRSGQVEARLNTDFNNISLAEFTTDFSGSSYLSGISDLNLTLTTKGADTVTLRRNLDGSGKLMLRNGELQGTDIQAVLKSVETSLRSGSFQPLPQGGTTPFENTYATLAFNSGVVATQDFSLMAPGWQLQGDGILANLNDGSMSMDLQVSVDASTVTSAENEYDLGGYTLPIVCRGAVSSPSCRPNAEKILKRALEKAVTNKLGDLLQRRLGN